MHAPGVRQGRTPLLRAGFRSGRKARIDGGRKSAVVSGGLYRQIHEGAAVETRTRCSSCGALPMIARRMRAPFSALRQAARGAAAGAPGELDGLTEDAARATEYAKATVRPILPYVPRDPRHAAGRCGMIAQPRSTERLRPAW